MLLVERFDTAGARYAALDGRLNDWLYTLLRREPGANRALAAILNGQRPLLEGPIEMPLNELTQLSGPGPNYKWPKRPESWERDIAALMTIRPDALPPLLVRETSNGWHLPDGNHRLDAWRRMGLSHGWTIVWRDREPHFRDWWGPFPPLETPTIETVEPSRVAGFLPTLETEGLVLAALRGERVVGAVRLVPEFGTLTLRTLKVAEECRGFRLGARLVHHLRPHMEGKNVYCLAYPWLERFYGEFGFVPIDPQELPEGLRHRYEEYQDEKGCLALQR